MIRRILIQLLSILVLYSITYSTWCNDFDQTLNWQKWSPKVFEQAQEKGQLVLLNLTATGCTFCRKMDEITYKNPQVIETINRDYIPVHANEEFYPKLAKRYENYGRPATIIFDGNGTEIIKRRGYLRPQWMVWLLEAVAQNPSPKAHQ